MVRQRTKRYAVLGLLSLLMLSCTTSLPVSVVPSPFPGLESLTPAEKIQVLQARTSGMETLVALLAVSYTVGKQRGTFDLVVNYAAPDTLRFTALKDAFLSTQEVFDVLLTRDIYRVIVHDEVGEQIHQGAVGDFVSAYPPFRTFFVVGEAFFLPGVHTSEQPRRLNAAGTRLTTSLRSGVQARWRTRPDTLEITQGCLTWSTEEETIAVRIQYQDYRQMAAFYLPHRVTLTDRRLGFTAHAVVKHVEINLPLVPGIFALTP